MNLNELYKNFPFKSPKKFIPIAVEHGFSKHEAEEFLKSLVHDHKYNPEQYYLPIYSEQRNAYQFDTLIQQRGKPFLIIINVNTRKLYAYPMEDKSSKSVNEALMKFKNEVEKAAKQHGDKESPITNFTSDEDASYLSNQTLKFMRDNHIDYRTTTTHDHNRLGIINRVIRTLRDMNAERDFTNESMARCVKAYNNSIHSSIGMKPNEMNAKQENNYIEDMRQITDYKRSSLPIGSTVRTVIPKTFSKRRNQFSEHAYIVDSMVGNKYLIRAKDDSVSVYPRHQLYHERNKNIKIADSIDNASTGIVKKIVSYDSRRNKYHVIYEGGVEDDIGPRALRIGRPAVMSDMEKDFWKNQREHIPKKLS